MNKKTWDDDNKLDGEIIRCNTCGWEEAYAKHMDNRHDHICWLCGWDIRQTDKSVEVSYDQVEYGADKIYQHIFHFQERGKN